MREQIDAAIAHAIEPDERALAKIRGQNKLTARERVDLLLDPGSFVEDALLANNQAANDGGAGCPPTAWSPGGARSTRCRSWSSPTTRW